MRNTPVQCSVESGFARASPLPAGTTWGQRMKADPCRLYPAREAILFATVNVSLVVQRKESMTMTRCHGR